MRTLPRHAQWETGMQTHIIHADSPGDRSKYFPLVEYNQRTWWEHSIAVKLSGNIKLTGAFVRHTKSHGQELECTLISLKQKSKIFTSESLIYEVEVFYCAFNYRSCHVACVWQACIQRGVSLKIFHLLTPMSSMHSLYGIRRIMLLQVCLHTVTECFFSRVAMKKHMKAGLVLFPLCHAIFFF